MLHYIGSGGIKISGCAIANKVVYVSHKWEVNSILYIRHKAVKGVLERVAIKRVILNSVANQIVPIYQDTLNSLWNEDDLLTEAHAIELTEIYREIRDAQIASSQCK